MRTNFIDISGGGSNATTAINSNIYGDRTSGMFLNPCGPLPDNIIKSIFIPETPWEKVVDVKILAPNKVVEITFADGTRQKGGLRRKRRILNGNSDRGMPGKTRDGRIGGVQQGRQEGDEGLRG